MSFRARTAQVALTLLCSLGLVATPAVRGSGAPPAHEIAMLAVDGWASDGAWRVADVHPRGAVIVALDAAGHPGAEVRSRHGGTWTPWTAFAATGEHAPDAATAEAADADGRISEPVWIGRADRLQVRVPDGVAAPSHLDAVTASGRGLDWTPPTGDELGAAHALSVWPPMIPRSSWDPAGECQPTEAPEYADAVERVYVHHTAIFPEYLPEETDDLVRAMCVFHVERRGFADIGYNFLIDRYGRIYQGRAGGILRPVIGAHASGFNTGSTGIAIIGNFDEHAVPPAALESLDRLTAWLMEWHGIDPYAVTAHVSTGGDTTPHPAGESVLLPAIVGHRQTATNTSCPGDLLFEHVNGADPAIHRVAARLRDRGVEVGEPVHPPVEPRVVPTPDQGTVEPPAAVGRVLESVVAAVRTLATRRLDERLLPALGGLGR